MNWAIIIAVIAIGVYILASLLQGNDEDQAPKRPRPGQAGRPRGQRPAGDIDRFLEEMNRRRRQGAERGGETLSGKPLTVPKPRPAAPVRRPAVERPVPAPPRYEAPPPRPVAPPPPPPPPAPLAVPVTGAAMETINRASRVPVPAAALDRKSAATDQVLAMVRTPASLQAVFLLHEILAPPRCRRDHRPSSI